MQRSLVAILSIFLLAASSVEAQSVPNGFTVDTLVSSGLTAPNDFCILPDGRILICERAGGVKLFRPGFSGVTTVGTVPNVRVGPERGLLSLTVRDDELYVWYSRNGGSMRLSRFTLVGSLNAPTSTALSFAGSSERIILGGLPDANFNHNGGTVRFGPDGKLYLTNGDDADCETAPVPSMYQGKVFRLDVDGVPAGGGAAPALTSLVPANNPFAGAGNNVAKLLIATGLRNPYSMCIDPVTGDLFIADVGQGSREELNWYQRNLGSNPNGVNFGWPWREGFTSFGFCAGIPTQPSNLLDPIDDRNWGSGGRSIMCAGFIRNMGGQYDYGPAYEGNVFHNDYYNGTIERLQYNPGTGVWSNAPSVPGQPTTTYWGTGFQGAPHFDQGPDGAVYFVQHVGPGNFNGGLLKRIRGGGPIYDINFSSGNSQVCTSGETFGQPLEIQLTNVAGGAPVAGVELQLTTDGSAALGAPGPYITDANGKVSVTVSSTGMGDGPVVVNAYTLGAAEATADLFARKLEIVYVPDGGGPGIDTMFVDFYNTTNDPNPNLQFILGLSNSLQPIYPTIFGTLYLDLISGVNTFIIEDGTGTLGGLNLGPTPPFATPNWSSNYSGAPAFLSGQTWRFQAMVYDPTVTVSQQGAGPVGLGFTNPVFITYQ